MENDPFSVFLSQHPEIADVVPSKKYTDLIAYIKIKTRTIEEMCHAFQLPASEIGEMIEFLMKIKVLESLKIRGNVIYKLAPLGEEFLALYNEFRKGYQMD